MATLTPANPATTPPTVRSRQPSFLRSWLLIRLLLLPWLLVLGGKGTLPLLAGDPNFARFYAFGHSAFSTSVAAGDLNGDGSLDLVVGNIPHQSLGTNGEDWVYWNDGAGNLAQGVAFGRGTEQTTSVAVADLNGDGALDVVAGHAPLAPFN